VINQPGDSPAFEIVQEIKKKKNEQGEKDIAQRTGEKSHMNMATFLKAL
jgi:hypothetical protein